MAKREIDLSGINWEGLDLGDVSLEERLRLPPRKYRLHQWSDVVALKKRLGRWKVVREKELSRLKTIDIEIEKLESRLAELAELDGLKQNTEFSHEQESEPERP